MKLRDVVLFLLSLISLPRPRFRCITTSSGGILAKIFANIPPEDVVIQRNLGRGKENKDRRNEDVWKIIILFAKHSTGRDSTPRDRFNYIPFIEIWDVIDEKNKQIMVLLNVNQADVTAEQYLGSLGDELVRESSLPDDKYHLGKMILKVFKECTYPNRILQVDKHTGESESIQSFHHRTVRAALGMRARGLRTGDLVGILGPNHLDLGVPFIACLYDGLVACPMDRTWKYAELNASLQVTRPKIIFCQNAKAEEIQRIITTNDIDCEIITFDVNVSRFETIHEFLGAVEDDNEINDFKPVDFDTSDTIATTVSTSGSTGMSKTVCITHKAIVHELILFLMILRHIKGDASCLWLGPLQWPSGPIMQISSCLFAFTRIQISAEESTVKDIMDTINDFKPKWSVFGPSQAMMLLRDSARDKYDFTSLQVTIVGGADATVDLLKDLEQLTKGKVFNAYGMSETCGPAFNIVDHSISSCGSPAPGYEYKIVDLHSGIENGPNEPGELWIKGPSLFKEYYGESQATKDAFSKDGFLKSGDLFYKDKHDNFIFIDRTKMLLKYKSHQISPVEIENLIKQHQGVKDVGVTGVRHPVYGDLATACIVRTAPDSASESEIHDLVRSNLSPANYLRGGILFVDKLMMTSTHKIDRRNLNIFATKAIDVSTLKIEE